MRDEFDSSSNYVARRGFACLLSRLFKILVLGLEILRVVVLVSSLVIFFANATALALALDASINSSDAYFISTSTALILL